jgi:hypothetical protein
LSNTVIIVRILLAKFVVLVLPILLIFAGVLLVMRAQKSGRNASLRRHLGILLVALPVGVVVYIFAGITAARIRGDGHFYGVPFGGYSVSSTAADLVSVLIWMALVFVVLAGILRSHK